MSDKQNMYTNLHIIHRQDDVILRVNDSEMTDITHVAAVDALKRAQGPSVYLYMKRRRRPTTASGGTVEMEEREVVLFKGTKGLGFSIAGGHGNEHVAGDSGIFVTKITDGGAAQVDGQLEVGDRVLSVRVQKKYLPFN